MLVAITQKVEIIDNLNETRDCLDHSWVEISSKANFDLVQIPNSLKNLESWLSNQSIEGIILSGGNDLSHVENPKNPSKLRDNTEKELLDLAIRNTIPVLGVCRGMQKINFHFKGTLSLLDNHVSTQHPISINKNFPLLKHSCVNSYHEWGIFPNDLSPDLIPLAFAKDGSIEAFKHASLPFFGIMWHPERVNEGEEKNDLDLLKKIFQKRR